MLSKNYIKSIGNSRGLKVVASLTKMPELCSMKQAINQRTGNSRPPSNSEDYEKWFSVYRGGKSNFSCTKDKTRARRVLSSNVPICPICGQPMENLGMKIKPTSLKR